MLLEPKEKEENHRLTNIPEHLRMAIQVKKDWSMTWFDQFCILFKRTFKERWRDYFDKLRLLQALGVALLLGLLWWKSKCETEAQLRDQVYVPMIYPDIIKAYEKYFFIMFVYPIIVNAYDNFDLREI